MLQGLKPFFAEELKKPKNQHNNKTIKMISSKGFWFPHALESLIFFRAIQLLELKKEEKVLIWLCLIKL